MWDLHWKSNYMWYLYWKPHCSVLNAVAAPISIRTLLYCSLVWASHVRFTLEIRLWSSHGVAITIWHRHVHIIVERRKAREPEHEFSSPSRISNVNPTCESHTWVLSSGQVSLILDYDETSMYEMCGFWRIIVSVKPKSAKSMLSGLGVSS